MVLEVLLDGEAKAIARKAIEKALEGDMAALRLCLERLLPPRRDRPVTFELPKIAAIAAVTLLVLSPRGVRVFRKVGHRASGTASPPQNAAKMPT